MEDRFGGDRRKHPRFERDEKFKVFAGGGQRHVVKALNQGPGGAFLMVERVIKPGTMIVVERSIPGQVGSGNPHIVAKVLYFSLSPNIGVGVKWMKAISPEGISRLRSFLAHVASIEIEEDALVDLPAMADELPVSYDFTTKKVAIEKQLAAQKDDRVVSMFGIKVRGDALDRVDNMGVSVIQSEAPRQKRVVMSEDDQFKGREDSQEDPLQAAKEMEQRLKILRRRKEIRVKVSVLFEGRKFPAFALAVESKGVYIESDDPLPAVKKRVLVQFPLELGEAEIPVIIVGEVSKSLRNRTTDQYGVDLKIITVNEGEQPGAFKQYLKSL